VRGRAEFTRAERDRIRQLLSEKLASDRDGQKKVRAALRAMGFRISDWSSSSEAFTAADFDALIAAGRITLAPPPMSFGSDVDLSILNDPEILEAVAAPGDGMSDPATFTQAWLRREGFIGFESFSYLLDHGFIHIPTSGGLYAVIRDDVSEPTFLTRSVGGHFKGRDPTVVVAVLRENWVDGCSCLYLGKGDNLRRRIREYARYGAGKAVGHQGGRHIWQLKGSADLIVAWKETPLSAPREAERELLRQFVNAFGRLPFANLTS
jgi:hypothetical protein